MHSETIRALRHARGKEDTLKAHQQHCPLRGCPDCETLKYAARSAWAAYKRSRQADALPAPGQTALF